MSRIFKKIKQDVQDRKLGRYIIPSMLLVSIGLLTYLYMSTTVHLDRAAVYWNGRRDPALTDAVMTDADDGRIVWNGPPVLDNTVSPKANSRVMQQEGVSDQFFSPGADIKVTLDNGGGKKDITDIVGGWTCGEPMISLRRYCEMSGYSVSRSIPEDFPLVLYSEIIPNGDERELEDLLVLYIKTDDGRMVRYASGSTICVSADGRTCGSMAACTHNGNDDLYVPASLLPLKGQQEGISHGTDFSYTDDSVNIVFG